MDSRPARGAWRAYPLDGALLWFHPPSGTQVRWDLPSTRHLRRIAPRVVLFGITNHCNLACAFCSRDVGNESRWTVESAFDLLAGLAARGVLEVSFGGGEPLVFRGFERLVERLATETPLAVHFTTNGALLEPALLERMGAQVGEIRLSIYDDEPWEPRVAMLVASGVQFGANLLATRPRMKGMGRLVDRLADLGCRDLAILRYVGPDPALHLTTDEEAELAEIILATPLRTRLSACFGGRLDPVPRLFPGGDCGAGLDFLTISSDRRLSGCSFHGARIPVGDADDVLRVWREHRAALLAAAPRAGCARPLGSADSPGEGIRTWRAFASNNSGDCVMVGRFEKVADAERYVADLADGFAPREPFPESWKALLRGEGIDVAEEETSPDAMVAVGRSVLLHTDMALDDDFPSLRALVWRRGGVSPYAGVHVHETIELVAGLGFKDARALSAAKASLDLEDATIERRALDLYVVAPVRARLRSEGSLASRLDALRAVAAAAGATLAAELIPREEEATLTAALSAPAPDGPAWLWCRFASAEEASSVAGSTEGDLTVVGAHLLMRASAFGSRLGFHAYRHGGLAEIFRCTALRLHAMLWRRGGGIDVEALARAVRATLVGFEATVEPADDVTTLAVVVESQEPGRAMQLLGIVADEHGLDLWLTASPPRLRSAIGRIAADLTADRRRR